MKKKSEEKKRKNPFVVLLKAEWEYLSGKRPLFLFYLFLFIIAGTISLLTPLIIGMIFNTIQSGEVTTNEELWHLIGMIFLLLATGIGFWLFHGVARVLETNTGFLVGKNFINKKIQRVLDLPVSWHKDHHSGDTIDKLNKGRNAMNSFSQFFGFQILYALLSMIGSLAILLFYDVTIALIALVFSFMVLTVLFFIDKKLIKKYRTKNKLENKASASVFDYISNIITVITLRLKKTVRKEVDKKFMASFKVHKSAALTNELKWSFASVSIRLMVVLLLSYHAYREFHTNGLIMVGTLYILYGYLQKIGDTFYSFAHLYGEIVKLGAQVENSEPIDEEYFKIKSSLQGNLGSNWKSIDIKNLDFTYDKEGKKNHLDKINFSFKKGEKIALVGESGSGKSTLLSLLRGLYDSNVGSAFVDGKPLKHKLNHLADHITLIPQDPEIFNNTIKFNIGMGLSYKNSEINRAIKLAQFSKVVKRLDKGLSTNVMEKGVSLSGGEKQRLALARGILAAKSSDIVLMDEPTSSVDSMNEMKIHEQVFKEFKDKTVISSIHRLHLLSMFDTIYFFDKGKLLAKGNFREMKKVPKFNRLLKKYKNVKD